MGAMRESRCSGYGQAGGGTQRICRFKPPLHITPPTPSQVRSWKLVRAGPTLAPPRSARKAAVRTPAVAAAQASPAKSTAARRSSRAAAAERPAAATASPAKRRPRRAAAAAAAAAVAAAAAEEQELEEAGPARPAAAGERSEEGAEEGTSGDSLDQEGPSGGSSGSSGAESEEGADEEEEARAAKRWRSGGELARGGACPAWRPHTDAADRWSIQMPPIGRCSLLPNTGSCPAPAAPAPAAGASLLNMVVGSALTFGLIKWLFPLEEGLN